VKKDDIAAFLAPRQQFRYSPYPKFMQRQMSITVMVLAVLGVALAQAPQQQQRPPLPPGTASLSGSVVVLGSGQPITGASVELRRLDCNSFANPPEVVTAKTDSSGKFEFQNLHAGGWCIVATAPGGAYTPAEYMQRGVLGRGATIPIADGQRVTGIQLSMAPTGGIAGRIRDGDGEFMAHARVQVMEPFHEEGQRRLYILQVAQTNDLGEYRFFWLPPGPYYLAVVPENTRGRNVVSVQPPPGTGGHREEVIAPVVMPRIAPNGEWTEETYVPIYYPGERDPERAQPVQVQPGLTTNGIDIVLAAGKVRSYHIRGEARNLVTGETAAGAQLRLIPREWTATVVMPTATVDQKGNFDIAGVVPGSYLLLGNLMMADPSAQPATAAVPAPPRGAPGAANAAAPQQIPLTGNVTVEVSGSSLENVQFDLVPGVAIPGKIVIEGATTNPQRGLSINLVRQPDIVGVPNSTSRGMVQPDGTFNIQNIGPGEYRLYLPPLITSFQWSTNIPQGLQNMYVKSARLGALDLLTSRIRVSGGTSPGQIEVTIGAGGTFAGSATNDRRETLPNVTVVLAPDGAFRQRRDLYRTAMTDISGRFRMQGVPAAAYKAFAFEEVPLDSWQNAEFMRSFESRGIPVEIRDGNQTSADLQMIPAARR
jgi:hypothetical protein